MSFDRTDALVISAIHMAESAVLVLDQANAQIVKLSKYERLYSIAQETATAAGTMLRMAGSTATSDAYDVVLDPFDRGVRAQVAHWVADGIFKSC